MITDHISPTTLVVLWAVVAFGAIIPVLPTGAAVSAAAAVAGPEHPVQLLLVILVGAAGAYVGDITTYAVLSAAGEPLARRVGWLHPDDDENRLFRLRESIERHELRTLLISRLVPGGRIPVLLVAALTGYPWYRFASAALAAALLWSLLYAMVGLLGSTLLPNTLDAMVAAVVGAILLTAGMQLFRRWRQRSTGPESPA